MALFCPSLNKPENSLSAPIALRQALTTGPNGDDISAWVFGFWRRIAARRVDPERGKPAMKWRFVVMMA